MLSPEHVRTRRRGERLKLLPLQSDERQRAVELAELLLEVTRQQIGRVREEIELSWSTVPFETKDRRLYEGLRKLLEDACEFGAEQRYEPAELRRQVFTLASRRRQELSLSETLDRRAILDEVAAAHSLDPEVLERGLYADLKGAQRLEGITPGLTSEGLVERYELGQLQAALLRAVRVRLTVRCKQAQGYRRLFHRLKFQRLLYRIERLSDGAYRVEVDGPFSLFESVTKYGLQLALLVPTLLECDHVQLEADVRWGKDRKPLVLEHEIHGASTGSGEPLREEVATLLERLQEAKSPWRAQLSSDVLDLPGAGLCIPDLRFERPGRPPVYVEVMGFWSREAVWRRVELVEAGLGARVVFAVSTRLRVSEAVLDGQESSALYVYKGSMSPRALLEKVRALGER